MGSLNEMMVIYHGGCSDGFTAAWLFHRCWPDAEFVPARYGDVRPNIAGKDVYILDFSYPREVMRQICLQAMTVIILDHHVTAKEDLLGLDREFPHKVILDFDMTRSGAKIAFDYLRGEYAPGHTTAWNRKPWMRFLEDARFLVEYTEDRDLWRWKLPCSPQVNAVIGTYPHTWDAWDMLAARQDRLQEMVVEGTGILRAQRATVEKHIARACEVEMDGYKILSVNATTFQSEIAGKLAKGRPFGACWWDRGDGYREWSLRSTRGEGVNVAGIAARRGGGGHPTGAGFREKLPGLIVPPAAVVLPAQEKRDEVQRNGGSVSVFESGVPRHNGLADQDRPEDEAGRADRGGVARPQGRHSGNDDAERSVSVGATAEM